MLTSRLAGVNALQRQQAGSSWHVLANNKDWAASSPLSDPRLRPLLPAVKSQIWPWAVRGFFRVCWESEAATSPPQLPIRLYWPNRAPSSHGTNFPLPPRPNPGSEPRKARPTAAVNTQRAGEACDSQREFNERVQPAFRRIKSLIRFEQSLFGDSMGEYSVARAVGHARYDGMVQPPRDRLQVASKESYTLRVFL